MTPSRNRWFFSLLAERDLEVVSTRQKTHAVYRLRCSKTGAEFSFTVGLTPSDRRSDLNQVAQLRRAHAQAIAKRTAQ